MCFCLLLTAHRHVLASRQASPMHFTLEHQVWYKKLLNSTTMKRWPHYSALHDQKDYKLQATGDDEKGEEWGRRG